MGLECKSQSLQNLTNATKSLKRLLKDFFKSARRRFLFDFPGADSTTFTTPQIALCALKAKIVFHLCTLKNALAFAVVISEVVGLAPELLQLHTTPALQ
jgi:hypothetical protein